MNTTTGDNEVASNGQKVYFIAWDKIVSGRIKSMREVNMYKVHECGPTEFLANIEVGKNFYHEKPVHALFVHEKNAIQNRIDSLVLIVADLREEAKKIEAEVKHLEERLIESTD